MTQKERNVIEGGTLYYNASQQLKYSSALRKLVRDMSRDVKRKAVEYQREEEPESKLSPWLVFGAGSAIASKYDAIFAKKADKLADTMLKQSEAASRYAMQRSVGKMAKGLKLNEEAFRALPAEVSEAIVAENVALIRSIPEKYFDQISKAVKESIMDGGGIADIVPVVTKYNGVTMRRAANIALDQTRKAYNAANKATMERAGIKAFRWLHTGRSKEPRPSHLRMSGNVYRFDNLPIINKEQVDKGYASPQRGLPGEAINCTCTMAAVIELGE